MSILIPTNCELHDFPHSTMWMNNGIVFSKFKKELIIDLDLAKQMVDDRILISNGIVRPYLIDISNLFSIDKEGRNYLAGPGCDLISAGAIYTKNKLLAFIGNIFISLDNPTIPCKVFSSEKAAVAWLELYKGTN
ncbi:MAG: hypothetical protein HY062_17065 [Bacteroidetes bacterium]|nr:hypothetical protein [Bacteroidota bacterium]